MARKVLVEENIKRWRVHGPSRYWCCTNPNQETIAHVFRRSLIAIMTWSYFSSFASINIYGLSFRETIMAWCNVIVKIKERPYFLAFPCMIVWELWRRRNNIKHEGMRITEQE